MSHQATFAPGEAVGIDHVIMNLSFSSRSDAALKAIEELAGEFRLVIWDPQSQDACLSGT
ncbi:hypothetical protein [Streptomyces sp. NBC_00236]|uniref:hypothetical protein n=1 Tax=unclassified Streptomyces TaxID=2593676 RepID=UPI002E28F25B|nr:hypothetical protein [Streptomyces sp. NBC_00236]